MTRSSSRRLGPATRAIHAGGSEPVPGAPVVPPIVQSSTFFGGSGAPDEELRYTRYGNNPNQEVLAVKLSAMEGTEDALAVGSGMAATALTLLALTRSGDHVVASSRLYGTTRHFLEEELPRRGVESTLVDAEDPSAWGEAIRDETRLLFMEVPTNPTLRVFDLRPVARLAHEAGIVLAVDATFASPVNLRPVEHGADVVIHSATKFLGGHSDLIAGVAAGSRSFVAELRTMLKLYGPALDPHAAWLLDRGLRTLGARMAGHNANALGLARWLEEQPEVATVVHPGLESHPDHALAREILDGFGGLVAFVLESGEAADRFCRSLEVALMAPSLGGVETLVSQPRHTSHVHMSPGDRAAAGIPDGFVRVSVGLEDLDDLQADFRQALDRC